MNEAEGVGFDGGWVEEAGRVVDVEVVFAAGTFAFEVVFGEVLFALSQGVRGIW